MRALLLLLALAATSLAENRQIQPNRLYELRPKKPSAYIVQEPIGLQVKSYELKDGSQAIVFFSGAHQRIVITVFSNGERIPEVEQYILTIKPGPEPPSPPDPEPEGLAGIVARKAKEVGLTKAKGELLGANFASIESAIAAGGIKTLQDGLSQLAKLNERQWPRSSKPLVDFLEKWLEDNVNTVKGLQKAFGAIAKGLRSL